MPEHDWAKNYGNILKLARWLVSEHCFTADELLGYLDKPWHWTREWNVMLRMERKAVTT